MSARERYIEAGPTTPPPAPETSIAAVFDAGVAEAVGGRWRKPATEPSGPSSTATERGLTIQVFWALGG